MTQQTLQGQRYIFQFQHSFIAKFRLVIATFSCLLIAFISHAQPGAEIELNKPKKYENRRLRSEKTGEKKFTFPRKVYQNTVTHYNYYFNANNRLNDVVTTAKTGFKDDYSKLLSFYNYSLETTAQNKTELDSIVYKCTAGILLHDLRNSWIDNLYLLLGKAYLFRNDLDSAALTFQYLNFSFAPKEGGSYDIPIGSNASNETGEFSIATKEKSSIFTKLTSRPPSRNESFLWQIRTFIERNELPEAAGIIEILRHDPNFPARLQTDLHEALAYWYYKQQVYDSAATHLVLALPEAENTLDKARREYLIAQLYQLSKRNDDAVKFYNKAIDHTTDPVMDVYARLNSIRIQRTDKKDLLQENIDALHKMAKKSKYEGYRDIIYYASASIEVERKNTKNAKEDLLKSVKYSTNNPAQRSQSFLLLADMSYDNKNFVDASDFYDSLDVNVLAAKEDKDRVTARKPPLKTIAENTLIVVKEDSLQMLASLPADKRDALIKKQEKAIRKAQGLKDEEPSKFIAGASSAPDLFANSSSKSNDFYFYNASLKAKGFSEFRAIWGERPNVDNWRRKAAVDRLARSIGDVDDVSDNIDTSKKSKATDNSFEGLQSNIPLTAEKKDASNKSIADALYTIGSTFMSNLEEYPDAIKAFEELLKRFPNAPSRDSAMFQLVYLYGKTGDRAKADFYKNKLLTTSPGSKWAKMLSNPKSAKKAAEVSPATKKYEDIYNMFIEGNFEQAKNEKVVADSLYGRSYWTPQLLFIEAIYYIRQQDDSTAIRVLTDLSTAFDGNPMAEKAKSMIAVLKRRKEIETELANLQVSRQEDEVSTVNNQTTASSFPKVQRTVDSTMVVSDSLGNKTSMQNVDTVKAAPTIVLKNYNFVAAEPHYVVLLLDKVDKVYVSEAQNAFSRFNREKYYNQTIQLSTVQLDERYNVLLQGPFADATAAIDYVEKVRPQTKSRILPWLAVDKYSFLIISDANLTTLKAGKDLDAYKQLLQQAAPGKF